MFNSIEFTRQRFQKSILIFLFLFLALTLIITWSSPATGYEASMYGSSPLVLMIALVAGEFTGLVLVVFSLSDIRKGKSNNVKIGLILVFLVYTISLSLFIIRGYYMWCMVGDPATHLGIANEILRSGHIPSSLFYPALHIFLSELCLVTTLSPVALHKILSIYFDLICVVFFYLFVRVLSSNRVEPVIAAIISCPFVFSLSLNLTPNGIANLLLPLTLFLMFKYLKGNNAGWEILFCIILILFPVLHPLPSIVLGVVLLSLWISPAFRDTWSNFREKNFNLLKIIRSYFNHKVVIPFLILVIWFVFWYSSFYLWGHTIRDIYQTISSEGGSPSQLASLSSQINYAQGYGYNVFEIFLRTDGGPFLIMVLSVIAFPLLWVTLSRQQKEETIFSLYGPWMVLCFTIPVLYVFNLPFGPLRFLTYVSMFGSVFTAALVSYILIKNREIKKGFKKQSTAIISVALLGTLFLCGFLTLYPSPYTYTLNFQTTHSEISGMSIFFKYRDVAVPASGSTLTPNRFGNLLLDREQQYYQYIDKVDKPVWHFGYDTNTTIASSYTKETDLIITKRDTLIYTDYYPNLAKIRFTPQDFARVKEDPGANLVYLNGEFDLLAINPKGHSDIV